MRITLVFVGFFIVVVCFLVDMSGELGVALNLGYFVAAFGCLLAAGIWKPSIPKTDQRLTYEIYAQLAGGGLAPDDLLEKLAGGNYENDQRAKYKAVLGKLLEEGLLVIREGRIELAPPHAS